MRLNIGRIVFLCFSLLVNVCTVPIALFIGVMATDAPGSGLLEFFGGFLFIQGIPLALLLFSIFYLVKNWKSNKTVS